MIVFFNIKVSRTIQQNVNVFLQQRLFKQAWWRIENPFKSTFKFSNNDINKFIFLWEKSVYAYKYMDEWEKFNITSLFKK